MHNRSDIEDKILFDGLFQFIKKNTALPKALAALAPDSPDIKTILNAILTGDEKAAIFLHPESHLFILYLMQEGKIPFWQGITAYTYIMSLMQFTDKLQPKNEDNIYQRPTNLSIFKLSENGMITQEGLLYLEEVTQRLSLYNINPDPKTVHAFILSLPPIEQWVIDIPAAMIDHRLSSYSQDSIRNWLATITSNYPLGGAYTGSASQYSKHCIPSSSLLNYFIHPVRLQPIFGSVNWGTLERLHQHNTHPLPLYSPLVKSNTLTVHGRKGGFVPNKEHDALHAWMARLLSEEDRYFIFYQLLPQAKEFRQYTIKLQDKKLEAILTDFIENLIDLDLSPVFEFQYPHNRLHRFISRILPDSYEVFILIFKEYFGSNWSLDTKARWNTILNFYAHQLTGKKIYERNVECLHILVAISEVSSLLSPTNETMKWHFLQTEPWRKHHNKINKPISINWPDILKLIKSSSTIDTVWDNLLKQIPSLLLKSADTSNTDIDYKNACTRALKKFNASKASTWHNPDYRPGFVASMAKQIHKRIDDNRMEEINQAKARLLFK